MIAYMRACVTTQQSTQQHLLQLSPLLPLRLLCIPNPPIPPTAMGSRIATSLPNELILLILLELPVPDLIIAAAALPPQWSAVLENLGAVRRHVVAFTAFQSCDFATSIAASRRFDWVIKLEVDEGELYISRRARDRTEGFLLVCDGGRGMKTAVPESKWAWAEDDQFWSTAELELLDHDWEHVCKVWTFCHPDAEWEGAAFVRFMRVFYMRPEDEKAHDGPGNNGGFHL